MSLAADPFLATLALVGAVIILSALLSGLIERSGFPQVAVLLGLGAVLGPYGLALVDLDLESPVLRAVATLSLTLVLFTDALSIDLNEIRRHLRLTLLVVGPGTLVSAVLITLAAHWLLGLGLVGDRRVADEMRQKVAVEPAQDIRLRRTRARAGGAPGRNELAGSARALVALEGHGERVALGILPLEHGVDHALGEVGQNVHADTPGSIGT